MGRKEVRDRGRVEGTGGWNQDYNTGPCQRNTACGTIMLWASKQTSRVQIPASLAEYQGTTQPPVLSCRLGKLLLPVS